MKPSSLLVALVFCCGSAAASDRWAAANDAPGSTSEDQHLEADAGVLEHQGGPGGRRVEDARDGFKVFRLGAVEGVVVPAAQLGGTAHWIPEESDLVLFESGLVEYLRRMKMKPALLRKLPSFKREYIGDTIGGRRILTSLFFCRTPADWGRRLIVVQDGGDCFFDVQFDPLRRRFVSLSLHGDS